MGKLMFLGHTKHYSILVSIMRNDLCHSVGSNYYLFKYYNYPILSITCAKSMTGNEGTNTHVREYHRWKDIRNENDIVCIGTGTGTVRNKLILFAALNFLHRVQVYDFMHTN